MKKNALDVFACPLSGGKLSLTVFEEQKIDLSDSDIERAKALDVDPALISVAVKEGVLYCDESNTWYPIINFVPLLLDYSTEIHRDFLERHKVDSEVLSTHKMPDNEPRPGEQFVQKNFTTEWSDMPLDGISFFMKPDQRDVNVKMELDWKGGPLTRTDLKVLEVGCGAGFESLCLERVTGGLITGIDLNLSMFQKGPSLALKPFVNVAVASLFAVPARLKSFDLVYSSGVIHHTYSTKDAFDEICKYRKDDGYVFIWVYANEDLAGSARARLNATIGEIIRPILGKMPSFIQNPIIRIMSWRHYRNYLKHKGYNYETWTMKNSEHLTRDNFTIPFAHCHSFKEVMTWFGEKGLTCELTDPKAYLDFYKEVMWGISIGGGPCD